ncbi:radical SAM/SPASM domain-containing protein [Cellulosilyticum ruminicola]|uniref:radical SAM/SPASM domain-containing protein n=1 Tax=Cellulosilyticum ruminicola TaxID=425254 RepID=UPI0006CF7E5A|nr:radical SAM protein [Cellulosilyticum ruminicola]
MEYMPTTAVWEVTMGCNMQCKHCGSRCKEPLPDELTTEEALDLCDQIGDLGLQWITLSGGEPLTRKDICQLIARLRQNNVIPNIITNGWLLTEEMLDQLLEAGVGSLAISIDGLGEKHDYMRRPGSFERDMKTLELMDRKGATTAVITTVTKGNINDLEEMYQVFKEKNVKLWQLQIGLPMGNLKDQSDLIMDPEQVEDLLDFMYSKLNQGEMKVYPADCVGYYTDKDSILRGMILGYDEPVVWSGCGAGKHGFGILQNGEILGCTSIRDRDFIEGSIRERSLRSIWEDEESFSWSRKMSKDKLSGQCKECMHGDTCLGGCSNTRITMQGDVYGENEYCAYSLRLKKCSKIIEQKEDKEELLATAYGLAKTGEYEVAKIVAEKLEALGETSNDFYSVAGFIYFTLGKYEKSLAYNEAVLKVDQADTYAKKGKGLCLCKMNQVEEGLRYIEMAANETSAEDMEPYEDWIATLCGLGNTEEALRVFEKAEEKQAGFIEKHQETYDLLKAN